MNTLVLIGQRADPEKSEGNFKSLLEELNLMINAILSPIHEALAVMEQIANRDPTARVIGDFSGDHYSFKTALNTAIHNLDSVLSQVASGAEQAGFSFSPNQLRQLYPGAGFQRAIKLS